MMHIDHTLNPPDKLNHGRIAVALGFQVTGRAQLGEHCPIAQGLFVAKPSFARRVGCAVRRLLAFDVLLLTGAQSL
ncbi:Uncharacterised protein [Serratia ficaria]|nr:Uncharacterised protein [Serratia ficaria]